MSEYMAKTLFFTLLLYCSTTEHKCPAEFCGKVSWRHSEQFVFSDPYRVSQYNRWNSPYLDHDVEVVQVDDMLELEVVELNQRISTVYLEDNRRHLEPFPEEVHLCLG